MIERLVNALKELYRSSEGLINIVYVDQLDVLRSVAVSCEKENKGSIKRAFRFSSTKGVRELKIGSGYDDEYGERKSIEEYITDIKNEDVPMSERRIYVIENAHWIFDLSDNLIKQHLIDLSIDNTIQRKTVILLTKNPLNCPELEKRMVILHSGHPSKSDIKKLVDEILGWLAEHKKFDAKNEEHKNLEEDLWGLSGSEIERILNLSAIRENHLSKKLIEQYKKGWLF